MNMHNMLLSLVVVMSFVHFSMQESIKHKPSQGNFTVYLGDSTPLQYVVKTVYNETEIFLKDKPNTNQGQAAPETCKRKESVTLNIVIIGVPCKGLYSSAVIPDKYLRACLMSPQACTEEGPGVYWKHSTQLTCGVPTLITLSGEWKVILENKTDTSSTKKRSADELKEDQQPPTEKITKEDKQPPTEKKNKTSSKTTTAQKKSKHKLAEVPFMGEYIMILAISEENGESIEVKPDAPALFQLEIGMRSPVGYLSADEYPLKTFYLIMCIVYVFYALGWLIVSACNYHDLLRVQFWIGGVILLGLIEKAVHYAEYSNVNDSGVSEMGTEKFAAFVECVKRTVARMLVIIVSLGFGIVKPRLGPTLHRVIGIGVIYFIVALLEKMTSIDVYFDEGSRQAWMIMYIPLAIVDSIICYWIFMSLLQTMKTLRLRRNTTKLALYRHFANTIVFCVLVSLGMMIWAIVYHQQQCNTHFANGWFETACWPMLFSIILLVIMILWRPNANNQRYAYSPMIDGNGSEDDDVEEPMLGSGATETMKMRGGKKMVRSDIDKTEEDLKWIEENIPQTIVDAAVPALLDSDEEEISTKYEMSKME